MGEGRKDRYIAQFKSSLPDDWTDAAYFPSTERERGVQFVLNTVGSNPNVYAGRLYDQISETVFPAGPDGFTKNDLQKTVHCFDDKRLRAHFMTVEKASAYANDLIRAGHQVKIYDYRRPKTYIDHLAEHEQDYR